MLNAMTKRLILTTAIVGTVGIAAFGSLSSHAQDSSFTDGQKDEINMMVKEYLLKNPEVIFESIDAFRAKEAQMQEEKAATAIKDNLATLTSKDSPSIGPIDADVTIVEFFDYNCGYCKKALPDVQAIAEKDKNVRFVFKEMPILGPTSMTAAQWAMAAAKQDKYFEFHSALMEYKGQKGEKQLAKIAKDLGLDVEQMKKDAASDAVQAEIQKDVKLAQTIGINGTPAFIVGETLYPGYIGEDGMASAIKAARAAQ